MLSLRAADPQEHPELLSLWRRSVEATHHFLTGDDIDAIERDVATYLPRMTDLRVASEAGEPVGFIAVEGQDVEMLFVDARAQGRGVGSALLASVSEGRELLRVDVNEQNPSGRAFYSARGFVQTSRSETDGEGRPFPILHLERRARPAV